MKLKRLRTVIGLGAEKCTQERKTDPSTIRRFSWVSKPHKFPNLKIMLTDARVETILKVF